MESFNYLSFEEIEAIHQATLRILAETGVVLTEPKARRLFSEAGAKIERNRVLLPPELVETCLQQAGKNATIRGRNGVVKSLGDGNLYFHNLGGAPAIYDETTGRRRLAVVQDVCDSSRLLDALENCHTITPFFTPTEVPGAIMSLAMYRYALPCTIKPLQGPGVRTPIEV